eukprot:4039156-Prymnesium_polylepis.1
MEQHFRETWQEMLRAMGAPGDVAAAVAAAGGDVASVAGRAGQAGDSMLMPCMGFQITGLPEPLALNYPFARHGTSATTPLAFDMPNSEGRIYARGEKRCGGFVMI